MEFPVSGIETWWWLPVLVSFGVSCITSTAGISGAFILLPYQVSILGFTAPGVTPTNLMFNIFAIPGGVYRLYKEKRMVWPLVWTMSLGALPGLLIGVIIRVKYIPDAGAFKLFVGCVMLYIAARLFLNIFNKPDTTSDSIGKLNQFEVIPRLFSINEISYAYNDIEYRIPTISLFIMSSIVGVIGGIYGIGGGAILAPILVTMYNLPIHTISGATLCSTFVSSIVGVLFYVFIGPYFSEEASSVRPDWLLGFLLGVGGFFGIYLGARIQKYLPAKTIKILLGIIMLYIAGRYIIGYFI
ncbi:MAG: sulfite exporter TauE/SafE family protein [candidate division Zixibacteria bacterium]|nr:sulfite exporter TauE/SafE family protein [candidate division Zixibacteria bacterium]